jgi:hypothetical protein
MTMDAQRLRNLTTRRLHTDIAHVYEDLEMVLGVKGLMTHMIPAGMEAVDPWLREKITDDRFFDGKYDTSHIGEVALPVPTEEERSRMLERLK